VPEGVDPGLYPYLDRPKREGLTTLLVGPLVRRKHIAEAVAAWQRAFAEDTSARLILKGKLGVPFPVDDPRIVVITETGRTRGIGHWYAKADVLLALGNEGFGLPLVEGMASGLPVIALSSEGQGDVCADAGPLVLDAPPARWEPSDDTQYGPAGVRGVPDVDATAERLRWVAGHREEARDLGREASAWAHRERNVWDKGGAVLELMEGHLDRPRPLRRLRTLWPDSCHLRSGCWFGGCSCWSGACGRFD
jgi:glycosyltransferase involved in cell wall biosynthesis